MRVGATALVAAALIAGCGSTSKPAHAPSSQRFAGGVLTNPFPERPLALRDYLGHPVDLNQYRGKAVLLTFLYVHCPDVCPLIAANLHNAQRQLGADAAKVQLVAVSADPRGDTPAAVATFLREHELTGRMEYLVGSASQLEPVWKAWSIASQPDSKTKDLVAHSALVFGISASGQVTTIYPANFRPADIVHDVPRLASM